MIDHRTRAAAIGVIHPGESPNRENVTVRAVRRVPVGPDSCIIASDSICLPRLSLWADAGLTNRRGISAYSAAGWAGEGGVAVGKAAVQNGGRVL